jgi:hypothetical protein
MALSISQQQKDIENKIQAIKSYNETSNAEKQILSKAGNSVTEVNNLFSNQVEKIKNQQKRFQRSIETSSDRLINLIQSTAGNGPDSFRFLRKIFLQTLKKMQPEILKILSEETIKSLGCSQEQTYNGINVGNLQIGSLQELPVNQGIYVPIGNIDLNGLLKTSPQSIIGLFTYEKSNPSTSGIFKPYGGFIPFPSNKMLHNLTQNQGQTYENLYGQYYWGKSGQNLFDIVYTNTNDLGVTGDYFRVFLLNRQETSLTSVSEPLNFVGQFVNDYYQTIQPFYYKQVIANVINSMTGAISIKAQIGYNQLEETSKFELLIGRILGLCFDEKEQIDVSGISKIGELDGVDDSFFELTDVDLRNIELQISNIQRGVVTFEDCGNVELPVDVDDLISRLVDLSEEDEVNESEKIIDSISQNKKWKEIYPNSVDLEVSVNKDFLKKLPKAIVFSVLNPKVLLPLAVMYYELEKLAKNTVNNQINQANALINNVNTQLQEGTQLGQNVASKINSSVDFIIKNKSFVTAVATRINVIFIEKLFEVLKFEIFNLVSQIVKDIQNTQITKKYAIILRLIQVGYIVSRFVTDYKKCKSLLDEISLLLSLIGQYSAANLFRIPSFLNLFSALLPGYSPERATVNILEKMQKLGLPTGAAPDGSPNFMNLFTKSVVSGIDEEETQNGKTETSTLLPPPFGLIGTVGKKQ